MRFCAVAAALVLVGCRGHVSTAFETKALPVAELSVDFPKNEEGRLLFSLDVPQAALGGAVSSVTRELWLGSLRFATGIEGPTAGVPQSDGSLRLSIEAPLVYRHVTWVEGSASLDVGLRAEVQMASPVVKLVRFQGRREVLVHGKPVLDEVDE